MVSVIVPVYNVKQYLPACIESVLKQTYSDWELLLVDYGSTDGSAQICDEYARQDSRICVFHKKTVEFAAREILQ
jgi:glycosyltransferase involved in cell wall biosynthesis